MDLGLAGKVAIVTGGASGMGAQAARLLVGEGARVVIADMNEELGRGLADELGEAAHFAPCDVTSDDQIEQMTRSAIEAFGAINLLFNNAGRGMMATTTDLAPEDWRRYVEVNLNSVFYVSRRVVPHLRAAGGGAIVNTASISGMVGDYAMVAYNAAKAGVINYTRSMALDHARDNIRVNAVCPGLIWDTAMTSHMASFPGGFDPWTARIPMGRGGNAIEVARVMLFLASDAASYLTGQAIAVDGGLTAHTGFPNGEQVSGRVNV
jgi:meso-butanediol dehydrogenase/(S,S)-butanediol dehydrogenase/diacetyl reductase